MEKRLGIDPQKHKEYLYHFYEGNFPGSWAKGELYNYDPATGDARSCGTTASLCGVEQALEKNDKIALDYAVKRDLLLAAAPCPATRRFAACLFGCAAWRPPS